MSLFFKKYAFAGLVTLIFFLRIAAFAAPIFAQSPSVPVNYDLDPTKLTEGKIGGSCMSNSQAIDTKAVSLIQTDNGVINFVVNIFLGIVNTVWSPIAELINTGFSLFMPPWVACLEGVPSDPDWVPIFDNTKNNKPCMCLPRENFNVAKLCINITKAPERLKCIECGAKGLGTWTSLGCLPNNFSSFLTNVVFNIGMGIAGMVALLGIIYSAIVFQTSQGNPEKIEMARESMTSFIVGLLLIIFSVFILRFLGLNVLQIVFGNL